ncbi:MAG TPA: ELWxxDGT repeat protein [Gemmataceae bacterium]|nr:ELWxxDGT repeat protein [Gemmataceae bacterium]
MTRLRLEGLETRATPAAGPVLVKDIVPGFAGSFPTGFAGLGGTVYFAAQGPTGDELWRTDGTAAGTRNVADIVPGGTFAPNGSQPRNLTAVGNTLFFTATDSPTGTELWKSNGTTTGTVRVKDIRLGNSSSSPTMLTAVGDVLYFVATDATRGTELWVSDGTESGTVLVADLTPGSASSTFNWLRSVGGKLYFSRTTGFGLAELYRLDPPPVAALTLVQAYNRPLLSEAPAVTGTRLFYAAVTNEAKDTLYVLDAAAPAAGPDPLLAIPTSFFSNDRIRQLTPAGDRVFFSAQTDAGFEPWVTDGTPEGTHLIRDINQDTPANNPGSNPAGFTVVNGAVYFAATTIAHGRELWRTDGTEAGTVEVADLVLGDQSSDPATLVNVGGHLVYTTLKDVGNVAKAVLRWYDAAADQIRTFDGFALSDAFGNLNAYGTHDGVLYAAQAVNTAAIGKELYKLDLGLAPPTVDGYSADTGVVGDRVTADRTLRLGGSAPPGLTVRVYRQTAVIGTTVADAAGQWTFTTAALADASHTFRAAAVNRAGVASALGPGLTIRVDTRAPVPPAAEKFDDNSGAIDSVTNDPTLTYSGRTEADATVRIFDEGTLVGEAVAGADGRFAVTTPALTDGPHRISFRAVDVAGNVSLMSEVRTITIDTVAPAAPAITGYSEDGGPTGDGLTNDNTPTFTGTAEPGSTVTVYDGATALGTATTTAGGTWQFTAAALADGPHTFTAKAADVAANLSAESTPLGFTIDTVRPTATVTAAAGQPDPTNGTSIAFAITFSKPVTGLTAAGIDLAASSVGGTLAAFVVGSGTSYTVTVTGMTGAGTVVAGVKADAASDNAGNGNPAGAGATVLFDAVGPAVTIDRAPDQADPTASGPILFRVTFSEPVAGFDETDVSFAGSTNPDTLTAAVTGSGAEYVVSVTGMSGIETVVASVPAAAAADVVGNPSAASTSTDNAVDFNDVGIFEFTAAVFHQAEEDGAAEITVTRRGGRGQVTVEYATGDAVALAGSDYTATTGTLEWIDGDTEPKSFFVPLANDDINEGAEGLTLLLSGPSVGAVLGSRATATLTIDPSDGEGPGTFTDADGDWVTVTLTPKTGAGSLLVYLSDPDGDGRGPIEWIQLTDTTAQSAVGIVAKTPRGGTGDGRVELGSVTGPALKRLAAKAADLVGPGVALTGSLGSVALGAVRNGAGITAAGLPTERTTLSLGAVDAGTAIQLGSAIGRLSAARIAGGSIAAPSAGTISIKGDLGATTTLTGAGLEPGKAALKTLSVGGSLLPGATVTAPVIGAIKVKNDLKADVTISGTGVPAGKPALTTLTVGGAVVDSHISVGADVRTVTAGSFVNSRLFAGYSGPDNGSGAFGRPSTVGTFRVTGTAAAFAGSWVIASVFNTVDLASVDPDNGGAPFGFAAADTVRSLLVRAPERVKYPGDDALGDFRVWIV